MVTGNMAPEFGFENFENGGISVLFDRSVPSGSVALCLRFTQRAGSGRGAADHAVDSLQHPRDLEITLRS